MQWNSKISWNCKKFPGKLGNLNRFQGFFQVKKKSRTFPGFPEIPGHVATLIKQIVISIVVKDVMFSECFQYISFKVPITCGGILLLSMAWFHRVISEWSQIFFHKFFWFTTRSLDIETEAAYDHTHPLAECS